VGVAVARVLVGAFGLLLIVGGIAIMAVGGPGAGLTAALTFFIPGAVLLVAVVIERTRYRSLHAERTGDLHGPGGGEPHPPEPRFQPTGERFVDPTTHVAMRVWADPTTGERRYVPEG
jgi:hypothetical protein